MELLLEASMSHQEMSELIAKVATGGQLRLIGKDLQSVTQSLLSYFEMKTW